MRYEQARDIIAHARQFHRLIADYYHTLSAQADKERLRMLLDYLERHERHLERCLAEYGEGASPKVLTHWFRYSPCEDHLGHLRALLAEPAPEPDAVMRTAMRMDDCIIDMYRKLAAEAEDEDIRAVFRNLLEMEERERRRVIRGTQVMDDL